MEGAPASEVRSPGATGGELRAMLNIDFRELRKSEVRRIPLLRTSVNKGKKKDRSL
jgi:hypothetical protein